MKLHPGPAAARTLLYAGYGVHMDMEALSLIEATKPTHVAIGINSVGAVNHQLKFQMLAEVEAQGVPYARSILSMGSVLCLHVWMGASEQMVMKAAEETAQLAALTGAGVVVPNPEIMWKGDETPDPKYTKAKQRMLKVAAKQDHDHLGALFVSDLRRHGFKGDVWPAVFFWNTPEDRAMVEAGTGLIAQMMSFDNPRKPGTQTPLMLPGIRQIQAWDHIERWVGYKDEFTIFGQQAIYHPHFNTRLLPAHRCVRASCAAYLGHAPTHREANLAFWELLWLRRNPWAIPIVASYSPRLQTSAWRAA